MRAATGSQCSSMSSGVTCALLGWLNTRHAAAFWIICSGFTMQARETGIAVVKAGPHQGLHQQLGGILGYVRPDFADVEYREAARPGDRGNVVSECQLIIDNDTEISCCFGRNKR